MSRDTPTSPYIRPWASTSSPRAFVASASILSRRAAVHRDSTEKVSASSLRLHRLRLPPVDGFQPHLHSPGDCCFFQFKMERWKEREK
ncbi:unnamed protein product [Linum trigynum]|uniref:Uncharacterized protein n=1 Tax=Linum trigynum TaxID=586398 RepID=A0AAV2FN19_9ROSI